MIFVGPGQVAACHTPRGFRRSQVKLALPASPEVAAEPSLSRLLSDLPPSRGPIDIILSSLYTRFQVLAPDTKISTRAERAAFSQMLFERDFGLGNGAYEHRMDRAGVKRAVLACAMDRAKLNSVIAACGGEKRVRSATPLFVVAFNRIRKQINDGIIALAEPGRLTVGFVFGGEWSRVVSRPTAARDKDALSQLLDDYKQDGIAGGVCCLFDPGRSVAPPRGDRWQVRRIETGESSFPLAACALSA